MSCLIQKQIDRYPASAAPCMERNGIRRYAMEELPPPAVLPQYTPRVNEDLL